MIQYFPIVTGSLTVLGNINVSGSITTSGSITISGSITSASFATSASNATNAISASYANNLTVAGTLTAQTIVVQTITSSVDYITGSSINGSKITDTHQFTGSLYVTGAFYVTTGSVGIGTVSPTAYNTSGNTIFELQNNINTATVSDNTEMSIRSFNRYASLTLIATGSRGSNVYFGTPTVTNAGQIYYDNATNYMSFTVSGSARMFISASGNVGIGTSSPTSVLSIKTTSTGNQKLFSVGEPTYEPSNYGLVLRGDNNTGAFSFYGVNATVETTNPILTMMRSSGNVGIGTTSPTYKLEVSGSSGTFSFNPNQASAMIIRGSVTGNFDINNEGASGVMRLYGTSIQLRTAAVDPAVTITSAGDTIHYGNIFLNQTSVATVNANATAIGINGIYWMNRLSGSGLYHVLFGNGGNLIGSITSNTTNTQFNTSSDYRLKKDLKDFNALDVLSNIKLYDFAWKLNDSRMYGVMAHELKEILPYAVVGEKDELDENNNIKSQGVDYSLLTPVLAKAIQELNTKFEEYKATHP